MLAVLLFSVPAGARVFLLLGPSPHGATAAGQPGWNAAYRTTLEINGGRADLDVLGVGLGPADAQRLLEANYRGHGAAMAAGHGANLGWGIALDGDRVIRWLVIPVNRTQECVVFRIEQTREGFVESGRRPAAHRLSGVPVPPSAEPRLYVADETTLTALEVSESRPAPETTARLMASALESSGWMPMVPQDPSRDPGGPRIYVRRGEICTVQVSPSPDGGSTVLRFHKRLRSREGL